MMRILIIRSCRTSARAHRALNDLVLDSRRWLSAWRRRSSRPRADRLSRAGRRTPTDPAGAFFEPDHSAGRGDRVGRGRNCLASANTAELGWLLHTFEVPRFVVESSDEPTTQPGVSALRPYQRQQGRYLILFLDDHHLSQDSLEQMRAAIGRFLVEQLRDSDRVTLIAPKNGIYWTSRSAAVHRWLPAVLGHGDGRVRDPGSRPHFARRCLAHRGSGAARVRRPHRTDPNRRGRSAP
jgi:hypothetical protein